MAYQPPVAPPPYDSASKYPTPDANPTLYPAASSYQPSYQPNMSSAPYPNAGAAPPPPNQTYIYVSEPSLGPRPSRLTCPHCHQQVVSRVKPVSGLLTWLLAGGCVLFGCVLGCCLIPFCMDDCQDCEHFCPNCNHFLGNYKRI